MEEKTQNYIENEKNNENSRTDHNSVDQLVERSEYFDLSADETIKNI